MLFTSELPLPIPKELLAMVYSYDSTYRDHYVKVMSELKLKYNQGLWWIYAVFNLDEYNPDDHVSELEWSDDEGNDDEWEISDEMDLVELDLVELDWNMENNYPPIGGNSVRFNDFDASDDICLQAIHHITLIEEIVAWTPLVYS